MNILKRFIKLSLFIGSTYVYAYGVSVPNELTLSGPGLLRIDEVYLATCTPDYPQEIRYGNQNLHMIFGYGIGNISCDFVQTDWSYTPESLYIPEEAGFVEGPLDISYETASVLRQTATTNLHLTENMGQLIYIYLDGFGLRSYWRKNFNFNQSISFPVLEGDIFYTYSFNSLKASKRQRFYLITDIYDEYLEYTFNWGFRVDPVLQKINMAVSNSDRFDGIADFLSTNSFYVSNRENEIIRYHNYDDDFDTQIHISQPASSLAASELHQLVIGSMPSVNRLVVISDIDQTVLGEIAVGSQPEEVEASFDGSWLSVWNAGDRSIMTVDIATLVVIGIQSMPEAVNAFSPAFGDQAFYTWSNGGTIYRWRYADAGIDRQVNFGAGLKGVSSNPEKDELLAFYDNGVNTTIQVLNGTTLEIEETQTVEGRVQFVPQYISGNFYKPMQQSAVPIPVLNTYVLLALLAGLIVFFGIFSKGHKHQVV
ncbi:MAG: YncE family protein [bacterium]